MRPVSIPPDIACYNQVTGDLKSTTDAIASRLNALRSGKPDISIIIPAYNEEDNILKTLSSLAGTATSKSIEIIVVNNNSSDATEALSIAAGTTCITETRQGITNARNAGLKVANGNYIINADADTIYPPGWIDAMVNPLVNDDQIALTYGRFSFIPLNKTSRLLYFVFEYISDFNRLVNKTLREEALNVYGFNSACRKSQCLLVDGFNHPDGTNEDGWLAVKLKKENFGRLHWVTAKEHIVWTTDRRILIDGGLFQAAKKRIWKTLIK